ncbi:DUF6644 family protein [Alteraurantiacibacter buctensis]|uniref:DUF6644 domain-containing protein n=1 Tax=Alteraurantiacibacter buctensis TaxID=1503981 RepID=A0A844YYA3_9SPHN|nr:DUF6644 family protein [Alteraurantiacibacter buctensis]MXO71998.1 hypothetical protein [Alteraurantiacibacter buctensis]
MYPQPTNIWESIEYSSLGISIAESLWAFPMIETIHVIALVTVLGTLLVMDLRMLGWASTAVPIRKVSEDTLKWTWMAFVVAAITGTLLWISKTSSYMINPYFLTKMGLMAVAGLNMLFFHFVTYKTVDQWDTAASPPTAVKLSAVLSLVLWMVIVFCGRAIGFTLGIYY